MNGKHITKNLYEDYQYAVDSNVYVKLSRLEKWIDVNIFMQKIIELGNKEEFFIMVNKYKPAAITMGWLREFLNDYIKNKIEK